jgi:hypothetical protein
MRSTPEILRCAQDDNEGVGGEGVGVGIITPREECFF